MMVPVQKKNAKLLSLFPLPLIIALLFDGIYGFFYYRSYQAVSFFDTSSYFVAADNLIQGKLDLLRTPVYPLFLRFCEHFGKDDVNRFCVSIQIAVFYVSIVFFYKTLEQFTKSNVMLPFGAILYGSMSSVIVFNTYMLTESLTVSGTVIFCYLMVRYVKERKTVQLTLCAALAFFLTMLRPSSVYLFVVVFIALVPLVLRLIRKNTAKTALIPIAAFLVTVAALFGYMGKNKTDNGYFGLSYVSDMNRFYDVVQADIWQNNTDREIVRAIQSKLDEGTSELGSAIKTEEDFRDSLPAGERIIRFNEEAISNHKKEYFYYLAKKIIVMGNTKTQYNLTNDSYFLNEDADRNMIWPGDLLDFNVNFCYLILLISIVSIVAVFCKSRKLLKGEVIICLMMAGQMGVNILSGPAEFHRLNVICYPLSVIILIAFAGMTLEYIKSRDQETPIKENSEEKPE